MDTNKHQKNDEALASSYISTRLADDNIPLIISLKEVHQNCLASSVYLMNQTIQKMNEMPAQLLKMALFYQCFSALSVDTLTSSLPQSWSHVNQPLEVQQKVMPNLVLMFSQNKVMKCQTRDKSLSKVLSASLTSNVHWAANTESSSTNKKGKGRDNNQH
ncbi:hypothetical protein CROQUDRAFT_132320 [Cronartium quercuum f. sp. fusiforme G11]|uniref:Uncharacterized protein n=1 Tax=Cronartium quercuum f. sp. fusiforme G11 TaxID=708437 RepID=A0A9P6NPH7_9BASI|nr:hypothetical protein CROQUDRAFT_132320 [Cronartium quercuum f. sp. fusiforme G11]